MNIQSDHVHGKTMRNLSLLALTAMLGTAFVALADDDDDERKVEAPAAAAGKDLLPPPSTKTGVTYAADIKPILDSSCVDCHSGDRAKARLHLDTLEGVLKGSKEGKILIPGNSANSPIVKAVAHATRERDDWMPPVHNKAGIKPLLPEEIGLLRAWIDQGAK